MMRLTKRWTGAGLLAVVASVGACSGPGPGADGLPGTGGSIASGGGTAVGGSSVGGAGSGGWSSGSGGVVTSSGGEQAGIGGAATGGASSTGGAMNGAGGTDDGPPAAPEGVIPNDPYEGTLPSNSGQWQLGLISPTLESEHHNQPAVINGYLQLTGNSRFSMYDISDPTAPEQLSFRMSPDDDPGKEAEGHQVTFAKQGDRFFAATIQGYGVDLWDVTDASDPVHVRTIKLDGIDFGDFTAAVWGLCWQGSTLYVGGTDTGLHVIDASDPASAERIGGLSNVGGINAGPVFAIGNLLVVTTPKENKGIATVDISNPASPVLLDTVSPAEAGENSYIGAFYGHHAYLLNPIRVYDVLSNPTSISLVPGSRPGGYFEYLSFQDGFAFAGRIRPEPGATKIDVTNPSNFTFVRDIYGRRDLSENDDQFTIAIGNLLVMSDDQLSPATNQYAGTVIAVHDTAPDTTPPVVDAIVPKDGATGQALTTRIGLSFTDNIELATVDARSFIVRPQGGSAIAGDWGVTTTVLNFEPAEPLLPGTTYEVVLPAGGVKDLVGNGIAEEFTASFTTRN